VISIGLTSCTANSSIVQNLHFVSSLWDEPQQNSPRAVGSFQKVTLYWCLCPFTTLNLEKQTSTCVDPPNTLSTLATSCRIEGNSLECHGYESGVWMTLTISATAKTLKKINRLTLQLCLSQLHLEETEQKTTFWSFKSLCYRKCYQIGGAEGQQRCSRECLQVLFRKGYRWREA